MTEVVTPPQAPPGHDEPDEYVGAILDGAVRRHAYVDNLKVMLVIGVIVGHTAMAWTGIASPCR